MNHLSSKQRKFAYLVGILILLVPIIWLGRPSAGADDPAGKLAQLRSHYDLGENQLGQVDPTSAAMNLVLLGFRGIAADLIWMQAHENEDTKNWAELRANVDAIVMLQPHFIKVWDHQSWNLAYNVSAAWDLVADRYYWVKEGAKFLQQGCRINQKVPLLPFKEGMILGTKIGRADEWQFYRTYFKDKDPNEALYKGGPDTEINPKRQDNYLAAKDQYLAANELDRKHGQSAMLDVLFRCYPYRSQLSYAETLQREGIFDEVSRTAWEEGYREWTTQYGQEKFDSPAGTYHLQMSTQDIADEAQVQNADPGEYKTWVLRMQRESRYLYWRTRAEIEAAQLMVEAHKAIYDGERDFRKGNLSTAKDLLVRGMTLYQQLLDKYKVLDQNPKKAHEVTDDRYGVLAEDDDSIEEALMAVLYWRKIMQLQFQPIPENFPLKAFWEKNQNHLSTVESRFKRENGQD